MNTDHQKYCLTVEEAVKSLEVSKSTIYSWLRSGKLDGKKLQTKQGPRWFLNQEQFILREDSTTELEKAVIKEELAKLVEKNLATNREQIKKDLADLLDKKVNQAVMALYDQLSNQQKTTQRMIKENAQTLNQSLEQRDQEVIQQIRKIQEKNKLKKSKEKSSLIDKFKGFFSKV
ncbi:helix-turn-helix domain-containing protein [Fuchsiella alkaliacetigena]|uniref:helix-turn-helix domain-containing protein n=1 Tax=Fuchsiella alkaliacetigena TaxID=957042 RepID=UPI00200B68EA|nr:helix-turn-helix domain-containing protein [Fuchsiella alkaliacetigena]MCK8825069.1 helix-turn-helix domain-containing protein [Fuchsiella alkaliacetigena]